MEPNNNQNAGMQAQQAQQTPAVPVEAQAMPEAPLKENKKGNSSWVLWLIIILIILGLGWFFLGRANSGDQQIIDQVNAPAFEGTVPDDVDYDEHGLPILGPSAPISSVEVAIQESFPVQASLIVSGDLPNGCTYLNSPAQVRDGSTFYASLTTRVEGDVCTEALVPYERNISLDVAGLPAGTYVVDINGQKISFDLEQDNFLNFQGGSDK